jgi:hypothetical protein
MARSKRLRRGPRSHDGDPGSVQDGTGGFLGQIGLFESANGLPHGPGAILLAIILAIVVYPIYRLGRLLARR